MRRIHPLLVERGQRGLIRRIHGDLHLGNIVLIDGGPVLFDAIEFSPLIASGDVLYDLAFLLMDLVERGPRRRRQHRAQPLSRRDAARRGSRRARGAAVLSLSMRAAIRAKVTAARLGAGRKPTRTAIKSARAPISIFARRYRAAAAVLVAVGGLSGTGKSVLARALAPELAPAPGAVVLRSDVERKALFGKAENETLPPTPTRPT